VHPVIRDALEAVLDSGERDRAHRRAARLLHGDLTVHEAFVKERRRLTPTTSTGSAACWPTMSSSTRPAE
jgi:hypothetical protein